MTYTKRQKTLLDRIAQLINKIETSVMPLRVTAVYGFGSLFRLKPNPSDVDLVIQYDKTSNIYKSHFWNDDDTKDRKFLNKIRDTYSESNTYYDGEDNRKTVKQIISEIIIGDESSIIQNWVDGMSWKKFDMDGFCPIQDTMTTHYLENNLPRISINRLITTEKHLEQFTTSSFFLLWKGKGIIAPGESSQTDLTLNDALDSIFQPEKQNDALKSECENFSCQVAKFQHILQHRKNILKMMLDIQIACQVEPHINNTYEWFDKLCEQNNTSWCLTNNMNNMRDDDTDNRAETFVEQHNLQVICPTVNSQNVENQRLKVKELSKSCDFISKIKNLLRFYCFQSYYKQTIPNLEFDLEKTLGKELPKKLSKQTPILNEFGIDGKLVNAMVTQRKRYNQLSFFDNIIRQHQTT